MSVIYISQKSIKFALVISFIYNVIIKRGKGELPSFLCNLLFGNFTLIILFFCYVIVRLLYAVTFFLLELNLYYMNKNDIKLLGNKLKSILMAVVLLSLTSMAMAQKVTVQGTVTDQNGETVIGAAILEKGTSNGTVTDFDGKYTLKVEKGATLVFSYIGYITEEFVANSDQTFNLVMKEDTYTLEEVVAVGYGSQTKKEITGSISSVKSESFNKGVTANPMGLIQGKVAGLTIIKNGGDDPAQNSYDVQLRGVGSLSGSASPLYVIDGVPGGDLSSVLPSDIESIDVLKDGSAAAIYGTRANAGVILITTRRGSKDGKFHAEYNGTVSTGVIADAPKVLNAQQYRELMVSKGLGVDYGADTDWMKAITRTPISHTHNVSISGGNENFNFRASGGYRGLQGIALKSNYEEINGRFAANQKAFNKRLEIAYDFSYTTSTKAWANYDNFNQAVRSNPTMPIKSDDPKFEKYGGYFESDNFYTRNPVSDIEQTTNDQKDQAIIGSVRATLNIIEGLKFSTFYSIQNKTVWNGKFQKSTLREVAGKNGVANQSYAAYTQQVVENTLQYFDQWGAHSFQAMIGQSYQTELNQAFSMQNTDFPLDELLYNNMGLGQSLKNPVGDNLQMSSSKYKDKLASFFARVMYNYDQRYFLSASVRFEGSSKFGKEASKTLGRWGVFPSISASWNIAGEDFMAQYDNLDDMKLRFGYGVTGNMPGSSYLYLMTVGAGGDYIFSNGQFIQPWGPTSNVNPTIRWEEKHEFNLGYDFATFKNRFTGSLDLYFRNTTDLLYEYDVPMPPYPYGKRWDNYGQIYNYGVELQLNGTPIRTKNWNWDISLNAAWNNNKVVRITGEQYGTEGVESYVNTGYISSGDGETGSYTMRLAEGQPIGNFYGYKFYTIDENGDWIFSTPAGGYTKNPTESDRMIIGNAQPFVTFGLSTTLTYKEFDLGLNFRGQIGGLIFNETRYFYENTRGVENCLQSAFEGEAAKLTNWITSGSDKASIRRFSDFYLENASYFKLNDLTIGYTPKLGEKFSKWIHYIRVYFTAQNLFTITGYSGHDPAAVSMSGLTPGFDGRSYYPTQRGFNLGLQFKF